MISRFVENFCDDYWLIENYEEAVNSTDMWELHHRAEVSDDGLHTLYSKNELINNGLYFHRPAEELVFLSRSEHVKLHRGTIEYRDEARKKMSEAKKGRYLTDEHREKISEAKKGRYPTDETRKKISEAMKGKSKPKYKWQDPDGNVYIMDKSKAYRYHPDWKLIEEQ